MKRGALRSKESRLVPVWFPDGVVPMIDQAAIKLDSDRSKFIRLAVREKLTQLGLTEKEAA